MRIIFSLVLVGVLMAVGLVGSMLPGLFGVAIPYAALAIFIGGIIWRVFTWARSPVPFKIPTTMGQQKSLPWIKQSRFDNPQTTSEVVVRMLLEVFLFRSLFKNTRAELKDDRNLAYGQEFWLWIAGLIFHYSFLVVVLRHFRFFVEPVPRFVGIIESFDGFFEIGAPVIMLSGLVLLGAVTYLFFRRVYYSNMRYISLPADYFPLFLIGAIALTGILMRHFEWFKVDLNGVKHLAVGLFTFNPTVPEGIGFMFFIHLFLVCALIAYFPFSKLTHMAGIFMSPTRNMANNSRAKRHINPWNPEVKTHTYMEWEDEFRELMADADMRLEKPLPKEEEKKE